MRRPRIWWISAFTLLAVLGAFGKSHAQEMRRDATSNGVVLGAGAGAAVGALLSLVTKGDCSIGACIYLGAMAGGLVGHLADRKTGQPRSVAAGAFVDDRLWDGALIGAVGGMSVAALEAGTRCGPGKWPPCTREGILLDMRHAARWGAIVGLLVDAAIPSRLGGRRVGFTVRF